MKRLLSALLLVAVAGSTGCVVAVDDDGHGRGGGGHAYHEHRHCVGCGHVWVRGGWH